MCMHSDAASQCAVAVVAGLWRAAYEVLVDEAADEGDREVVDANVRRRVEQPPLAVGRHLHLLAQLRVLDDGGAAAAAREHADGLVRVELRHGERRALGLLAVAEAEEGGVGDVAQRVVHRELEEAGDAVRLELRERARVA